MTNLVEERSSKARTLPPADRVRLAEELLATVYEPDDEIEAAWAELAWEVQYCANIDPQLGERFATVVERALVIDAEFPDMGSPHRYGTRRVFPKRFPFSVVYLHRSDEILVLAIAPDDRKPGYWRSRMVQG